MRPGPTLPTILNGVYVCACRMAEWLKKQAERDGDKEQRRLDRLHRKLKEPTHTFTSSEYEQQRHDLSERLEASVLQGTHNARRHTLHPCRVG